MENCNWTIVVKQRSHYSFNKYEAMHSLTGYKSFDEACEVAYLITGFWYHYSRSGKDPKDWKYAPSHIREMQERMGYIRLLPDGRQDHNQQESFPFEFVAIVPGPRE